jgi:HAD superfamily hydrolase (TIGR01509 family)
MIKSVLFDLDGTLIFAEKAIIKGIQKCFMMYELNPPEEEKIRKTIGLPLAESFTVLQFSNPEEGANLYREFFLEQPEDIIINPESYKLLDHLVKRNIQIGIVTNRKLAKKLIDKLPFPVTFDIVIDLSLGIQPKPSPEGVLYAITQLKVSPQEVIFVGDTHYDIIAGKSAGVNVVGYSKGIHEREILKEFHPDWMIDSLNEIFTILERT